MVNLIKGLEGDYEIHEIFNALLLMENEKIAKKIAASLHPPKCPGCGRGIVGIIEKADRGYEFIQYRCRRCGTVLANGEADAVKFMKGEKQPSLEEG